MSFNLSFSFGFLTATRPEPTITSPSSTDAVSAAVRVRVYPRWYKFVALEWSIPPSWGSCVFNVYHSASVDSSYVKITSSPLNGNSLIDYTSQDYSKFRSGFYIVEVLFQDGSNQSVRSKPVSWQNTQRRWVEIRALEIQRREQVLLQKFTGVKSYLFRKRTYGKRCSSCWDPISETVTQDHCTVCYGTSFEGGYFPPTPLFIQYEPTPSALAKTYFGKFEPNQIGAWTISMPDIHSDDILIRIGDWNLYKVGGVQNTELQAVPVRQIMQLTQLGRRDIENDLVTKQLAEFPTELANAPSIGDL